MDERELEWELFRTILDTCWKKLKQLIREPKQALQDLKLAPSTCSGRSRHAQECAPSAQPEVAAAHVQTLKLLWKPVINNDE